MPELSLLIVAAKLLTSTCIYWTAIRWRYYLLYFAAGPSIKCEKDRIDIEFDGRALTDEMLVARNKYVALSGHTDTPECGSSTYVRQPGNNITVFKLTASAPLDNSCGSDMMVRIKYCHMLWNNCCKKNIRHTNYDIFYRTLPIHCQRKYGNM